MKYRSLGLGVFILIFILLLVGRYRDNSAPVVGMPQQGSPVPEASVPQKVFPAPAAVTPQQVFPVPVAGAGRGVNSAGPRVLQFTVNSPGAVRLANRVKLAEAENTTMLQYYEKDTGDQRLYFFDGSFGAHVLLPGFKGIQSDRIDFRGTRFDQVEHVLPSLNEVWIFSEAPTETTDGRLGYMSPVLISRYALTGSPLPTKATLRSSRTFGDEHSRTGAFISLQSGGMIASWYQSHLVEPHGDRRPEVGIAYRSPRGRWSTKFPIAVNDSKGGRLTQSRQAMAQHPADDSIWLFNKRDSAHSMEVVHLSETGDGLAVDWVDPLFINDREHKEDSVESEFPAIMAISDPTRNVIILAYGDKRFERTTCGGTCFRKVTHVTVVAIAADGTKWFEATSPFTIERTTRFGMALSEDKLSFVYKPLTLTSRPPSSLEAISLDLKTGSWSEPLVLGEAFRASREIAAVFSTPPLDFAYLMADEKIHYFMIENE